MVNPPLSELNPPPGESPTATNRFEKFIHSLRGLTKSEASPKPQMSPLEKVAAAISNLMRPENRRLLGSSVGYPLAIEAILGVWESYGEPLLTLFYNNNREAFTPNPETVELIEQQVAAIETKCIEQLTTAQPLPEAPFNFDLFVRGLGSTREMFNNVIGLAKNLTPEQITVLCQDPAQLARVEFVNQAIIPEVQMQILRDLNHGFEAARVAGIYMVAYSLFRDKLFRNLDHPEAGKGERALLDVFTDLTLAFGSTYLNAMLTYIHTGGFFAEAMTSNLDTAFLCSTIMSGSRILLEWHFKDPKNIELVEYAIGAGTLALIAGLNTLTVTKFMVGLFG